MKNIEKFLVLLLNDSLCLNELRKNLAANLERSPLTHRHGYGPAGDRPTLFARFPLIFVPFMQYTG
jgi:hypothetical protein